VLTIVLVIIAACVLAICLPASAERRRVGAVLGYSGLFFLGAQVTWAALLFFGAVPIDEIFRSFGLFSDVVLEWYGVIGLVPPLLASLVFAVVFWRRTRGSHPIR
jgi:hypothetical protein